MPRAGNRRNLLSEKQSLVRWRRGPAVAGRDPSASRGHALPMVSFWSRSSCRGRADRSALRERHRGRLPPLLQLNGAAGVHRWRSRPRRPAGRPSRRSLVGSQADVRQGRGEPPKRRERTSARRRAWSRSCSPVPARPAQRWSRERSGGESSRKCRAAGPRSLCRDAQEREIDERIFAVVRYRGVETIGLFLFPPDERHTG